jgi:uncharacterized membrane protein
VNVKADGVQVAYRQVRAGPCGQHRGHYTRGRPAAGSAMVCCAVVSKGFHHLLQVVAFLIGSVMFANGRSKQPTQNSH